MFCLMYVFFLVCYSSYALPYGCTVVDLDCTVATYVQYREAAMSSHKSDFVSAASQTELFGQLA